MGSHRSRGKKGNDIGLHMECYEDELSPAQLAAYNKVKNDFAEFTTRIESLIKNNKVDVAEKSEGVVLLQVNSNVAAPPPPLTGLAVNNATPQVPPGPTPISLTAATMLPPTGPIALQAAQPTSPNLVAGAPVGPVQLVMDPRGFIVGTVAPQASTSLTVPVMAGPVVQQATTQATPAQTTAPSNKVTVWRPSPRAPVPTTQVTVAGNTVATPNFHIAPRTPTTPTVRVAQPAAINSKTIAAAGKAHTPVSNANGTNRQKSTPNAANSAGTAQIVDLTDDDGKTSSDNREVTFNKLSGKTYPSLVVVARPNLKIKDMSQSQITQERTYLDTKVKGVLMYSPTKFTEWLIQQGLVRSEQYCCVHVNNENNPVKLKLGMYSDISKFPYSGGYVWISDCCPQKFVSVFSGSIFEGAPHAPTVLLKLMYHWACQTNVQNIIQWVKVENPNIKNFYTTMRAVCTAAVHEKYDKLGGPKKRVEVGVISLGTTSQDGNIRKVKVEVLGVMEPDTKLLRLHAVEPVQEGEHQYKRRFARILAPLERWVHKESVILTDMTVDKGTLHQMGFNKVYQVTANTDNSRMKEYTNSDIMDYLRKIVPRMFQNTLSLLSRQIIQQFLDELVWRERWGPIASQAFDTLITHISDQTKLQTDNIFLGDTLVARLSKIASNPFKDWSYANWKTNCMPAGMSANPVATKRQMVTPTATAAPPDAGANQPASTSTPSTPALSTTTVITAGPRNKRQATSSPDAGNEPEAKKAATSNANANINANAVASTNNEELIALEPYYYGTIPGNREILEKPKYGPLNMKCVVCNLEIRDNLAMMKHLIGHSTSEDTYSTGDTAPQCRYCLQNFATETAVSSHIEEVHLKTTSLTCLICEEKFRSRMNLISHMQSVHDELELPYVCGICKFRTSQHTVIIDHFYEVHHENERGQCPFCLKVLMFESNNRRLTNGLYYYLNHMQRHQLKTVIRKCTKCKLSFVNKESFRDHQKDHNSCRDVPGVARYPNAGLDSVMMPKVANKTAAASTKGGQTKSSFKPPPPSNNKDFIISNFDALHVTGVADSTVCVECKGQFNEADHFVGYNYCLNCRFATCCNKAMVQHKVTFHEKNLAPVFNLGKPVVLDKALHCVCGFKSNSGNKLAKHLAVCHRKSAYPSAERAAQCTLQSQSASFPPLVTLDEPESEDRLLRAYIMHTESQDTAVKENKPAVESGVDPPSMLNILGLVRKASTEDSNQEKPSSSDETPAISENSATAEKLVEQSAKSPAEKPVEQPAEKSSEQPVEQPAEKSAEQPSEKSAEQPAEKSAEKPADQSTAGKPDKKESTTPAADSSAETIQANNDTGKPDKENQQADESVPKDQGIKEPQDTSTKMDCDDDVCVDKPPNTNGKPVTTADSDELMVVD